MPLSHKKEMVDVVKEKFILPPGTDHWTIKSVAKKWRNWKSRVKANYNEKLSVEQQLHKRPKRVSEDQWKNLLNYWKLEKVMSISNQNKKSREAKKMMHTTGKLSFAEITIRKNSWGALQVVLKCLMLATQNMVILLENEVGETLKEINTRKSKLPPDAVDRAGPSDIFGQVTGERKGGRVLMYGLGVSASDVWGEILSRNTCHCISMEYKISLEEMQEKFKDQANQIAELRSMVLQQKEHGTHKSNEVSRAQPRSSNQPSSSSNSIRALKVGAKVSMQSILEPSKVVANGFIRSLDPLQKVGVRELGPNWCEVEIRLPIEWEEHLIRPYGLSKSIGDAFGATVAWPCSLVTRNNNLD